MIGNGAGDKDAIATLDEIGSQPATGRDHADTGRCHIQTVGCTSADDLGVTGDDCHTGRLRSLRHVGDNPPELADSEALL